MDRNKKDIFGILLPQVLWALVAITARFYRNQLKNLAQYTTFDQSLAAPEITYESPETTLQWPWNFRYKCPFKN